MTNQLQPVSNSTEGGTKHDSGKLDWTLLPFEAVEDVVKVLEFGATKYTRSNWRGGFEWTRLGSAALRHIISWLRGEDKDPETGLSHLAHAACCILFLISHEKNNYGTDNRDKV